MVVAPPPAEAKAKAGVASGGDDSDVETLLEISGCAMRGPNRGGGKANSEHYSPDGPNTTRFGARRAQI
jgi:hypothetical protein